MDRLQGILWGSRRSVLLLLAAACLLMLTRLGGAELWTHEGRWGVICQQMLRSGDFLHPFLFDDRYDDKPLLSYWVMVGFAFVLGGLDEWALRLPAALASVLAVWCTYRLGRAAKGAATGLLAGWIVLTCFEFVFWGRLACADMLNLAGTVAAVAWYVERRHRPDVLFHAVLFTIIAATCLMKGLVGAAITGLAILPLLLRGGAWRRHLRPALLIGALPAALVYFAPFLLARSGDPDGGGGGGLELVFRENIVRFFQPFDHEGDLSTYLVYLPVYFAPWCIFLPGAVWRAVRHWRGLDAMARWPYWASLLIFGFLTASGSRRSYYILPILPFVALLTADSILAGPGDESGSRRRFTARFTIVTAVLLLAWFGFAQFRMRGGGLRELAEQVRTVTAEEAPLREWEVLSYDGLPKAAYYLSPEKQVVRVDEADPDDLEAFLQEHPRTVIITRREALDRIVDLVDDPLILESPLGRPEFLVSERSRRKQVMVLVQRAAATPAPNEAEDQ